MEARLQWVDRWVVVKKGGRSDQKCRSLFLEAQLGSGRDMGHERSCGYVVGVGERVGQEWIVILFHL